MRTFLSVSITLVVLSLYALNTYEEKRIVNAPIEVASEELIEANEYLYSDLVDTYTLNIEYLEKCIVWADSGQTFASRSHYENLVAHRAHVLSVVNEYKDNLPFVLDYIATYDQDFLLDVISEGDALEYYCEITNYQF